MAIELKTFYADVELTIYNVEFKAHPDTSESILHCYAIEAARDKLNKSGPGNAEVEMHVEREE